MKMLKKYIEGSSRFVIARSRVTNRQSRILEVAGASFLTHAALDRVVLFERALLLAARFFPLTAAARLDLELDLPCAERDFDVRIPALVLRELLPRDVRVPVSLARPEREELRFARALLRRVDADRDELRALPSPARAVVFLLEERPSPRFWLRECAAFACPELGRAAVPSALALPRREVAR